MSGEIKVNITNTWSQFLSIVCGVAAFGGVYAFLTQDKQKPYEVIFIDPLTNKLDTLNMTGFIKAKNDLIEIRSSDKDERIFYPADRIYKITEKPAP